MKTLLVAAVLMLGFGAQSIRRPSPGCVVQSASAAGMGSHDVNTAAQLNRQVYVCQAEIAGEQTPVTKAWFKQHCKGDDWRATCDAYAPNDGEVTYKTVAGPRTHTIRNIAIGAAVTLVVAACIVGGGCGAMGGGE